MFIRERSGVFYANLVGLNLGIFYFLDGTNECKKEDVSSVISKRSPNIYKSCPKIISLVKLKILTPLQKLPKNVGDLGKLSVAKG